MTIHVFAAIVTGNGTAANNRGLTEGNMTTLQKLLWHGEVHTTVSAEAIRFALRRRLQEVEACNRVFDEDKHVNTWTDAKFATWKPKASKQTFIDDDLLGFMAAEAAQEEGGHGTVTARRAVLELTRAVSLTPWPGDVTFNAASPNATPSAQRRGAFPVPYGTEVHATRYQYGVAMTPGRLRVPGRAMIALRALSALGAVAGNHGRFLFDFSPDSIVLRITQDPAPRLLYSFAAVDGGTVGFPELVRKVRAGDIQSKELIIGGSVIESLDSAEKEALAGAQLTAGVMAACEAACARLKASLK